MLQLAAAPLHAALAMPPRAPSYGSAVSIDQATWSSPVFWSQLDSLMPNLETDPALERYRGFLHNLQHEAPGEVVREESGQELLRQYVYPGLQPEHGIQREPFPEPEGWLESLEQIAPLAQEELSTLLRARPTLDDDMPPPDPNDDEAAAEVWNRAAWAGWQFLSLRDAKAFMPGTIKALRASGLPSAHRFIGIARQAPDSRGSLHSDQRNYLLSTLTGLIVPREQCGLVVPGSPERALEASRALVLDNTFPHYVFNRSLEAERFVLMVECWHPELSAAERGAMATLFALKDRFTVLSLRSCPWGFSEDELVNAIEKKQLGDLNFWRDSAHGL